MLPCVTRPQRVPSALIFFLLETTKAEGSETRGEARTSVIPGASSGVRRCFRKRPRPRWKDMRSADRRLSRYVVTMARALLLSPTPTSLAFGGRGRLHVASQGAKNRCSAFFAFLPRSLLCGLGREFVAGTCRTLENPQARHHQSFMAFKFLTGTEKKVFFPAGI